MITSVADLPKVNTPWGEIGYITNKRTYARRLTEGDSSSETEEFPDQVVRVIKACRTQLKVGFTEAEEQVVAAQLLGLKGSVAGRFWWQLGTKTVTTLGLPSLQNCFGVETKFYTDEGVKSFSDFDDGDEVVVRGRKGWKSATVKNFGVQELVELSMVRGRASKTIRTTLGHRWITDGGIKTTAELVVGDIFKEFENALDFKSLRRCPIGVQHGVVFGDGHKVSNNTSTAITVCGDSVDEIRSLFVGTDAQMITGLPWFFKELPDLKRVNSSYLFGFLTGWLAADGSMSKAGVMTLANKNRECLSWFKAACVKLGIKTGEVRISRSLSPFDSTEKPLYRVSIIKSSMPDGLVLLSKHRERLKADSIQLGWRVESVSGVVSKEDVWCVVEPENEEFTLDNNILTKNCAFTTVDEPIRPFTWAMDMLMLGCGVGFNIQREYVDKLPKITKKKVRITRVDNASADFIVPDTREGWVKLLGKVLKAYFLSGKGFTYSTQLIRGLGAPIKSFGGTASGAEILVEGIELIIGVLEARKGQKARPIDCLDIMNIIGMIVVAGNVRRSALIALGDYDDIDYLRAKRWDLGGIPNWRSNSNNSVVCSDISKLPEEFWEGYKGNGEPYGLINLEASRKMGRIGETQYPDPRVTGYNPCAEQSLEDKETCCLAEIFLPNINTKEELFSVAQNLYRICKHSLSLHCHNLETEEVVHRNMRMGLGITGYLMSTDEQKSWLSECYEFIREYDKVYSAERGWPASIKLTTVKPSGTLSLLAGVTSGGHPAYSEYYIRRIRIASDSKLVDVCRQSGYPVEYVRNFDKTEDRRTVVVEFPCKTPAHATFAKDLGAVDQLKVVQQLQRDWSDNAVSVTIYYTLPELPAMQAWLAENYTDTVKSVSFLLHNDHGFDQAPLEEITREEYEVRKATVRPIAHVTFNEDDISADQIGCVAGVCPLK